MDEYGGPGVPPRPPKPAARVHRPAAAGAVSLLLRPRPEAERERNAYVETPQRARPPPAPRKPGAPAGGGGGGERPPVTVQPIKRPCAPERGRDSVVCAACGRCRCEQCSRPRPLPSKWLCDFCLCSAESAVDYASCMCCVKALLYHCDDGAGDGGQPPGEACGCGGRRAAARWGWLAALSVVLPCLCLYWPLRACVAGGAHLYSRATLAGCRCAPPAPAPDHRPSSII